MDTACWKTVLMSLPKDVLVKGRGVALPFSYEWESGGDGIEHQAYLNASELPRKAATGESSIQAFFSWQGGSDQTGCGSTSASDWPLIRVR